MTYISDNATPFSSQKLSMFFNKYGITHSFTPPYTPKCNGLVERANATILAVLSKFALEFSDDWDKRLQNLILSINMAKQSSTQFTPFFLLHGYEPRIPPNEIHLGTVTEDITRLEKLDELNEARILARKNITKTHISNKKRYDQQRKQISYKPGDLVWYEWHQTVDNKLTPKYKGPYVILTQLGTVCYRITKPNSSSSKDEKVVHIQNYKLYNDRPNLDEPTDEPQVKEPNTQQPIDGPNTQQQAEVEEHNGHEQIEEESNNIRKSNRIKKPSFWLNDYQQ